MGGGGGCEAMGEGKCVGAEGGGLGRGVRGSTSVPAFSSHDCYLPSLCSLLKLSQEREREREREREDIEFLCICTLYTVLSEVEYLAGEILSRFLKVTQLH